MAKTDYQSIDEYIDAFPSEVQSKLHEMRAIIKKASQENITEAISYQMPTFKFLGSLVHFAANKNHIGFYPSPSGIASFSTEFDENGFKWSKGAVQFPIDQDLPAELITKIVQFRIQENLNKQKK